MFRKSSRCIIEVTPQNGQCVEISFPTVRHLSPEDTKAFTLRRVFENNLFRFDWVKKVKAQQDRKGGPSVAFAALLEQVQRYESFTEAELREEAHRLVKV